MEYVVYLDAFFLMNFILDLIVLFICYRIRGYRIKLLRNIAAAAIGGLAACIYVADPFGIFTAGRILANIVVSMIIALIAFGYENMKKYAGDILLLYVAWFAAGGLANVMYFSFGCRNILLIILITAAAGIGMAGRLGRKSNIARSCMKVRIYNAGKCVDTNALIDTGNTLTEPYGGRPVSILETQEAEKIIDKEGICVQKGYMKIPYHSIGEENGMMDGFVADKMCIETPDGIIKRENVVIGVYNGKISADSTYGMILNPRVI